MGQALLSHKIETALQNLYITASYVPSGSISSSFTFADPLNIYRGEDNEDKAAPAIIVSCAGGAEVVLFSGVFRMATKIMVKEMAADITEPNIATLADKVFEIALDPTMSLATYDTEHTGLGIMDTVITNMETRPEGDAWVSTLFLDYIAAKGG